MRIEPHTLGSGQRAPLGLALGGGVARGWAHIGAMRALIEAGIRPDIICLLYTSPSPRDRQKSRMPSSA